MKHLSTLLPGIIITLAGTAQPTLQQNNGFQLNTSIQIFVETNPIQDEGNGGVDQTWDFSSLISVNGSTEFDGVMASTTPFAADFPDAQFASASFDYSGNMIYNYFTNDNALYTTWGYESDQLKLVYTNPRDILHYPFTYGDSFSDSYYGPISGGYNAGVIEEIADGYGNLILPTGIFHNCLRVMEVRKDTLDGDLNVTTSNDTSYKFYVVNYPEPLCQVNHHHASNGFDLDEIYWQDVQPSGLSAVIQDEAFSAFPNPCHDILNIGFRDDDINAGVKITDAFGRVVESEELQNHSFIFNTAMLPAGIYFLSVETHKGKKTYSFVKE
ncbi:MAG TPA: T9SS type A sorting domain-containing protein [Chitinophagales bacterium]|nr:T9SS type A sorting domain-containing protein [Chitinophagales bacterium]